MLPIALFLGFRWPSCYRLGTKLAAWRCILGTDFYPKIHGSAFFRVRFALGDLPWSVLPWSFCPDPFVRVHFAPAVLPWPVSAGPKQAILCVLTPFAGFPWLGAHATGRLRLNQKEQACFTGLHFTGSFLPETVGMETFPVLKAGNVCFNRPYGY